MYLCVRVCLCMCVCVCVCAHVHVCVCMLLRNNIDPENMAGAMFFAKILS